MCLESFACGNKIASIKTEVARTGRPEAKRESVKLPVVPVLVFLDCPYQGDADLRQDSFYILGSQSSGIIFDGKLLTSRLDIDPQDPIDFIDRGKLIQGRFIQWSGQCEGKLYFRHFRSLWKFARACQLSQPSVDSPALEAIPAILPHLTPSALRLPHFVPLSYWIG